MEQINTITNIKELTEFAEAFLQSVRPSEAAVVIALHGDLGAGKTTLVQQFGHVLGITEPMTSPTFTIMRQYPLSHEQFDTLAHIDAYRIEDVSECGPLRINELFLQSRTLVCIEWAERLRDLLPPATIHITLEINPDESRTVQVVTPAVNGRS